MRDIIAIWKCRRNQNIPFPFLRKSEPICDYKTGLYVTLFTHMNSPGLGMSRRIPSASRIFCVIADRFRVAKRLWYSEGSAAARRRDSVIARNRRCRNRFHSYCKQALLVDVTPIKLLSRASGYSQLKDTVQEPSKTHVEIILWLKV